MVSTFDQFLAGITAKQNERSAMLGQAIIDVCGCKCGYVHDEEVPCNTGVPTTEFYTGE